MKKWDALQETARVRSLSWLQRPLEEQPDKLDHFYHYLTRAEAAERKGEWTAFGQQSCRSQNNGPEGGFKTLRRHLSTTPSRHLSIFMEYMIGNAEPQSCPDTGASC